jgi:peptidoglycan/LPS O-acetylase OafA/YrhL
MSPARTIGDTRIRSFDGLRAICISGVVLLHSSGNAHSGWLRALSKRGWFGVDVFFVLSGFLITQILLAELDSKATINLPRFYIRRALRLQPAYFSALLLVLADEFVRRDFALFAWLPFYLTYSLNFAIAYFRSSAPLNAAWSLCIEEQFYFLWPWCLRNMNPRRALPMLLSSIGAITLYRTALYTWMNWGHFLDASPASYMQLWYRTDTRIDTILVGCAFALAFRAGRFQSLWAWLGTAKWFPSLTAFSSLGIAWYVTDDVVHGHIWRYYTYGATVAAFATGLVVAALFIQRESWLARLLSWGPLVYVGKVSYGIYLFHPFVIGAVERTLRLRGNGSAPAQLAVFFSALAGSTLVAGLHFQYVETRFLKLRDRKAKRDAERLVLTSPPASAL